MSEKFKVVISGISGRFPECDTIDTFKEKLYNGDDFITVDDRKWPVGFKHQRLGEKQVADATGKFLNFDKYDQTVFRMNKVSSLSTDIVNRMVLEPSFEAIVDAGINPYSLDGSNVSVFMSSSINELDANLDSPNVPKDVLLLIGLNKTMTANRLSYALNLKGPSYTTYVDIHGGLDSLALGYRYVSEGRADAAIVGAASSIVDPRISLQEYAYGLLSPDGVTRPFDEWANGYARSESVVCFYLQRAQDAKRNYGELVFCDSCCLGGDLPNFIHYGENYAKNGLQQLLKADPKNSGSNVAFVEMNACGHQALDKTESNAVAELMLAKDRKEPLLVGSIKSNAGHALAAAGLLSVLKALFALDSGILAPNRNLQKPNGDIQAFRTNQLEVVVEKRSLPGNTIAVNSFGLLGTVGLAILQQHEKVPKPSTKSDGVSVPRILLICGRQENDLKKKLTQIEESPYNEEFISLANDAFRQCMPIHTYRAFTLLPSPPFNPVNYVQRKGDQNRPVWFIFSGMGSQWNCMGKSLLKLPLFAETVAKCDRVLRQKNIDIYHILTSDDETIFDDILNAFVGIITVQIGLYEVVKALGIEANGIIGHSVGENACAYADGCLTLEQAVLASWARGAASNEVKTIGGMMAAIGKGYAEMKDILPDGIQVACHNSADSCTLTGPAEPVNAYVQMLKEKGVFAKAVNVANIAYHSKYIAPIGPKLEHLLQRVIEGPRQRSSKWISTSVPESEWNTPAAQHCSAEYLTNNLLNPVFFEEGCKHIPTDAICIEFAPHGLLQAILKRSFPDTCTNIPLTRRGKAEDNLNFLLSSMGMMYIEGLDPEVNNIFPAVQYPVPRGTPHISPYCTWHHEEGPIPRTLQFDRRAHLSMAAELIPICIRDDSDYAYLKDHRVDGNIVIPSSVFIFLTCQMFLSELTKDEQDQSTLVLERVRVHHDIVMGMQETKYASVMIFSGSGNFQVVLQDYEDSWDSVQVVLTGCIQKTPSTNVAAQLPVSTAGARLLATKTQFHDDFEQAGYKLGNEFSLVEVVKCANRGHGGGITWNGNWVTFLDALMKVQMFADGEENVKSKVPTFIEKLEITTSQCQALDKGTILPYDIDTCTRELRCLGLLMRALKYKTRTEPEVLLNSYRFVPYPNPRCQDIPEFLHLCLQIAIENVTPSNLNSNHDVLTVVDRTGRYRRVVENIVKQSSIKSVIILDCGMEFKSNECTRILMITDGGEEIAGMNITVENLFILVVPPSTALHELEFRSEFTKLVQQSFSENEFTLFRKNGAPEPSGINSPTPPVTLDKDLHLDDVSRLLSEGRHSRGKRFLYIMDEISNEERLDELVRKQMELDVPVLVVKRGESGSYRSLIQEDGRECEPETTTRMQLLSQIRAGLESVDYVCFDRLKGVSGKQNFGFSYVAAANSSELQMGFAVISKTGNVEYDPCLRWTLPKNCGLFGEAATMIYAYALAYKLFILFPPYRLMHAETAMINVGTEYSLAEAFIALSLYRNLKIFVTVDSDEDAARIKNRFPEISRGHILRSENCSYIQVKRILHGQGIDLIVNCLRGIEHLETSLSCLAINGVYIEVGTENCQWSDEMGLYPFLKLISAQVMRKEVSDLLELRIETKQTIQKFIDNLIKKEVMKPLEIERASIKSMKVMNGLVSQEILNSAGRTIKYDREHSYLILGTSRDDSSLYELIKWLINQGAGKFMIALEESSVLPLKMDRINRISSSAHVCILFSSATELDSREGTTSLLEQIDEKLGPLKATFYVGLKEVGCRISNLNDLVSPEVYFVGLGSAGLKEFEQRRARGFPAIFFHADEPECIMRALPRLNDLLAENDTENAEILYHVTNPDPRCSSGGKVPRFNLHDYLPHNLEVLSAIGQEEETLQPAFVEMTSLSKRYHLCKGVYPIFALPAAHSSTLQPLFQRLQYPVFSATTTWMSSMKDVAGALYSSLTKIQRTGPMSVISETWTLPLALELISYAKRDGRDYKIFILEGIPEMWADRVKRLQAMGPEKLDMLLANKIFHFSDKLKDGLTRGDVPFEDNIRMFAEQVSGDQRTVENVIKGARRTRNVISGLTRLQFPTELLEHVIWFERHYPSEGVLQLSVSSEILVFDELNYRRLLDHPEVSRAINRNALYSWWEYTKPENVE